MDIPIYIFLYLYLALVALCFLFVLINVYQIVRFSVQKFLSFLLVAVFLAGTVLIVFFSYNEIVKIDWNYSFFLPILVNPNGNIIINGI